jgi:hypothetical protein
MIFNKKKHTVQKALLTLLNKVLDKFLHKRHIYEIKLWKVIMLSIGFTVFMSFFYTHTATALYSAQQLLQKLPSSPVGENLHQYDHSLAGYAPTDTDSCLYAPAPQQYNLQYWLSVQNDPLNTGPLIETNKVPLQLNELTFSCYTISAAIPTNQWQDTPPFDVLPNGPGNDLKSTSVEITGYSVNVSSGVKGTVSNLLGKVFTVYRDNNSRYWFGNPIQFDYLSKDTSGQTVTLTLQIDPINSWTNGTFTCVTNGGKPKSGSSGPTSSQDFGACNSGNSYPLSMVLSPIQTATLNGNVYVQSSSGASSNLPNNDKVTVQVCNCGGVCAPNDTSVTSSNQGDYSTNSSGSFAFTVQQNVDSCVSIINVPSGYNVTYNQGSQYFVSSANDYQIKPVLGNVNGLNFTLKPKISNWKLSGRSTVQQSSSGSDPYCTSKQSINATPGETIVFHHCVTNDGPQATDKFKYEVEWTSGEKGLVTSATVPYPLDAKDSGSYNSNNTFEYNYVFTIPTSNYQSAYCQEIKFPSSSANPNTLDGVSSQACAFVVGNNRWTLSGRSTVSSVSKSDSFCTGTQNINAQPGQTVVFHHCVTNDGPQNMISSSFQYQVVWTSGKTGAVTSLAYGPSLDAEGGNSYNSNNTFEYNYTFSIPKSNYQPKYCQKIEFTSSSANPDSLNGVSSPACVTVNGKWTLSGRASVDARSANINDPFCQSTQYITVQSKEEVVFHLCVTNIGPENMNKSVPYRVIWTHGSPNPNYRVIKTGYLQLDAIVNNQYSKKNTFEYNDYFTIPSNAISGSEFCQAIEYTASSASTQNLDATSPQACAKVNICNLPPWLSANNTVDTIINMNAPQPNGTYSYTPPQFGPAGSTWVYATPNQKYEINQAYDQYTNIPYYGSQPTSITWSPTGWQNSNSFTLNYSNYIKNYPYDYHATQIHFTQQYTGYIYRTKFSGMYQCRGYTSSSSTCIGTIPAPETCTTTYKKVKVGKKYVPVPQKTCTCPSGYSKSNGSCIKTYPYPGTPLYEYYNTGKTETLYPTGIYYGAPILNEICPRNFDVLPPSSTDVVGVNLNPNSESPTSANVNTQTTVQFSLDYGVTNLRYPMQVNLTYNGQYYIEHADYYGSTPITPNPQQYPNPYSFTVYGGLAPGTGYSQYDVSFNVNPPPLVVGDQVCAQFTITPQQGQMTEETPSSYAGGSPTPNWSFSGGGVQNSSPIPTASTCKTVVNEPYSRAYGNDVAAGISFEGSEDPSACNNQAGITAGSGSGPSPIGSGSQFAAMALGQISGYASAFLRSALPTAGNGLSFANTTGTYGGNFANSCQPIYNYYLNRGQNLTNINQTTGSYDVNSNSGVVQLNPVGNNYVTLYASGNQISNEHVIYVNGNVYIPNNITYNLGNLSYNSSTANIQGGTVPNLYVIASGNIYIGPNVSQLDGTFVAENQCDGSINSNCSSSTGGYINTCADIANIDGNQSGSFPSDSLFQNCANQLTIQGSLIADNVKLERTYASLRNSVGGENPISGPSHDCSLGNGAISPGSGPDCSAEIFNFDPVNYLGNPNFSSNNKVNYDSIISLPPVL